MFLTLNKNILLKIENFETDRNVAILFLGSNLRNFINLFQNGEL